MSRALVLNATYEPLCVVATKRALVLVIDDKAELVADTGRAFHSARAAFAEPSIVRLLAYVKVPYRNRVALNRRAIFLRDNHRCQYCGAAAENIDHVVPRSRGGTHSWENVVAACRPCNARKEDRFLHETHMRLRRSPAAPIGRAWMLLAMGGLRPEWEPYLGLPDKARGHEAPVPDLALSELSA
ncbi:MAG TPA: HNH endonuclease [Acidimicrobiales bacterium]|jgi:5-methylcytosine-specific restriction endonuclease McrA|nr:HNH endonuclease [Acidimicrobiales bacterium]